MKKYNQLTQQQRYIIQDLIELGKSQSFISRELNVNRSTISREIKRNKNSKGGYKAKGAHTFARGRRRTAWDSNRKIQGTLEEMIFEKLSYGWSPEQISGRLRIENKEWSISHESIYNWIYKIAPECKKALRRQGRRQKRGNVKKRRTPFWKEPKKSIENRDASANNRTELGHWERDLVEGVRSHSAILVMVDRKSRYSILSKVSSHQSEHINEKTSGELQKGNHSVISMTNDNGIEFGKWGELEEQLNANVYFCHPYSSYERGTVENTNGLLRQFFPKKTNFDDISNDKIKLAQNNLNYRPRKIHNYLTPHEIHFGEKQKLINSKNYYTRKINQRIYEQYPLS